MHPFSPPSFTPNPAIIGRQCSRGALNFFLTATKPDAAGGGSWWWWRGSVVVTKASRSNVEELKSIGFLEALPKEDKYVETKLIGKDEKSGKINFSENYVKENYKGATIHPKWKVFSTLIYLEREDSLQDSKKIASFDFDRCLAKTYVERVCASAWSLMYASIPKKLQTLYNDGFKLVIFTNEANIERWKNNRLVAVDSKIGRLDSFINLVNVPIEVLFACAVSKGQEHDPFRKPTTGIWRIMEQQFNSGISIDMDQYFPSFMTSYT
ncbi:hypothetical protein L1887_31398 [Cichorium endivia]|nr:hypothetical protein L1887_31398 [Cichorium endivia]